MKFLVREEEGLYGRQSHPPRGEWIEIIKCDGYTMPIVSHPPRGEWIEMTMVQSASMPGSRLTPRGVSGLKLPYKRRLSHERYVSPPAG